MLSIPSALRNYIYSIIKHIYNNNYKFQDIKKHKTAIKQLQSAIMYVIINKTKKGTVFTDDSRQ